MTFGLVTPAEYRRQRPIKAPRRHRPAVRVHRTHRAAAGPSRRPSSPCSSDTRGNDFRHHERNSRTRCAASLRVWCARSSAWCSRRKRSMANACIGRCLDRPPIRSPMLKMAPNRLSSTHFSWNMSCDFKIGMIPEARIGMIPEAGEVRLLRKDRKVLETRCRSPVTLQRDLKRARIVLLAAAGRSTRSIAKEVGVQPCIVSLRRHRYADQGLEGLRDKPRPGKQPIYTKATDKRILMLLDKPSPEGFARWTGPLLAEALGDVDVQYVWRFLRSHGISKPPAEEPSASSTQSEPDQPPQPPLGLPAVPVAALVLCVSCQNAGKRENSH